MRQVKVAQTARSPGCRVDPGFGEQAWGGRRIALLLRKKQVVQIELSSQKGLAVLSFSLKSWPKATKSKARSPGCPRIRQDGIKRHYSHKEDHPCVKTTQLV